MALIAVTNATVKNANPSTLTTPFVFEISFRCLEDLKDTLTWRLIYVGSPDDKRYDQELESVELGPLKKGNLKFSFEAAPPELEKLDKDYVHGSTVLLLEASYHGQEFVRIGWYVHNLYTDALLQADPPEIPDLSKMYRSIVADEPRVTKFNIDWS